LMFAAALKLGRARSGMGVFHIPKGTRHLACAAGLGACVLTILVGFIPPNGIDVGGAGHYALSIALGNVVLIAPVALLCMYRDKKLGRR